MDLRGEINKTVSKAILEHGKQVEAIAQAELTELILQIIECGDLTLALHNWRPELEPSLKGHTLTLRTNAGLVYQPYAELRAARAKIAELEANNDRLFFTISEWQNVAIILAKRLSICRDWLRDKDKQSGEFAAFSGANAALEKFKELANREQAPTDQQAPQPATGQG